MLHVISMTRNDLGLRYHLKNSHFRLTQAVCLEPTTVESNRTCKEIKFMKVMLLNRVLQAKYYETFVPSETWPKYLFLAGEDDSEHSYK